MMRLTVSQSSCGTCWFPCRGAWRMPEAKQPKSKAEASKQHNQQYLVDGLVVVHWLVVEIHQVTYSRVLPGESNSSPRKKDRIPYKSRDIPGMINIWCARQSFLCQSKNPIIVTDSVICSFVCRSYQMEHTRLSCWYFGTTVLFRIYHWLNSWANKYPLCSSEKCCNWCMELLVSLENIDPREFFDRAVGRFSAKRHRALEMWTIEAVPANCLLCSIRLCIGRTHCFSVNVR